MELCKGQTLQKYYNTRPSKKEVHKIAYCLMTTLAKLHSTNVIHNDLKEDNIMIQKTGNKYEIRIIDFGHAKIAGEAPYGYLDSVRIQKYPQIDP